MKQTSNRLAWSPLIVVMGFILGMFCQKLLTTDSGRGVGERKFATILNLIENEYVDDVDIDSLIETTLPSLLANLDPHSIYIPASDLQQVNEELDGSFCGVGISFNINNDTIRVVEVISNGPAERVGIKGGDRIIEVDGENVAGVGITNSDVFKKLRGEAGSQVDLTIKRTGMRKPATYQVTRGEIPISSIDAQYMLTPTVGYIKVNTFGRTTYDEFWQALNTLQHSGAEDYVIDLRGNLGGLLETAVLMVNEFLPRGMSIVTTMYRHPNENTNVISDGNGSFQDSRVVVLLDEYSASSSEIFAGAIQDNDRGLIIGRRSFGKGLVQQQMELPDNSALRLTVGRYYTPSGRCIQKDYSNSANYEHDLIDRYEHGEVFVADSIRYDSNLKYTTAHGRTVYGGGGIIPDIFVPNDTSGVTSYYLNVGNAGLLQRFAFDYVDTNRHQLEKATDLESLLSILPYDDTLLRSFTMFAAANGIPTRWYYVNISHDLIVMNLKALIAREVLGLNYLYEILNDDDPVIDAAIRQFESGNADFPVSDIKTE